MNSLTGSVCPLRGQILLRIVLLHSPESLSSQPRPNGPVRCQSWCQDDPGGGRLWAGCGPPASSDSEEMEDRQGLGPAVGPPRPRQDPLGRSDNGYRSSPAPAPASQPQKAAAEALESSSELEQIFKKLCRCPE
ncbi:hypothetical protein J4Q44_G00126210 [Coregonus suidteri]|uniref:Uncharacterized protein n=1 Tax=Coregonus suidteri TaxID=861788 RepID=A0AAN8MHD1_9TELE